MWFQSGPYGKDVTILVVLNGFHKSWFLFHYKNFVVLEISADAKKNPVSLSEAGEMGGSAKGDQISDESLLRDEFGDVLMKKDIIQTYE